MKPLLFILLIVALTSCKESDAQKATFFEVECVKDETPAYDYDYVSLGDENGEANKDTLLNPVVKRRHIFKACRDFIYAAKFYDAHGNLLIESRAKITSTGRRWDIQPEKQDQITIQYEYAFEDEKKFKAYNLNKKLVDRPWSYESVTGIIENEERIWIHPFRSNQFVTNEVAPFPQVRLPLEVGKRWTSRIAMYEGWGDWENKTVYSKYEVVGHEAVTTPFANFKQSWKISSASNFDLGKTQFEYWFDEDYGFVKMNYVNYGGQRIEFELEQVIDR